MCGCCLVGDGCGGRKAHKHGMCVCDVELLNVDFLGCEASWFGWKV